MPKHPRKLLMIAGLCCIIPLSGANAPASAEPVWSTSDCPYARARAAALVEARRHQAESAVRWATASSAAVSVYDVGRAAPGLVP